MGGTRDTIGTPCWPDYAGSGGGLANPAFVRFLEQDLGDDPRDPDNPRSPRNVMNTTYFKPPFRVGREREEVLISEILRTEVGARNYPGERAPSPHWPNVAPGRWGIVNAFSPKYCDLSAFAEIEPRPDVLWVRGADDRTVSDTSAADFGYLGTTSGVWVWFRIGRERRSIHPSRWSPRSAHFWTGTRQEVEDTARRSSPTAVIPRT